MMKVEDVMSTDVVTVHPETPLKAVAEQLVAHRISGLPVVNDRGEVVGVISEADLLVKEGGSTPRRPGLLAWLLEPTDPQVQLKLEARVAGEAMSSPAVTIAPFRSLVAAAQEMLERGINRLPVVRDGRLVGIVSRADLVRAFARSDKEVAAEVREQIEDFLALAEEFSQLDVGVQSGEVRLGGSVRHRGTAEALAGRVARVPGVVGVHSELSWVEDDSKPKQEPVRERPRYPL
jgi:CBS domain-containing protein